VPFRADPVYPKKYPEGTLGSELRSPQVREGDADNPGKDIGSSSSSSSCSSSSSSISSSSGSGSGGSSGNCSVEEPPLLDLEVVETAAETDSSGSSSSVAGAAVAQAVAVRGAPVAQAAIGEPAAAAPAAPAAPAATVASVAALEAAVLRLRAELRAVVGPSPHEQRHALARHALPHADASELAAAVRANARQREPAPPRVRHRAQAGLFPAAR
jgi:hypothetical protein